MMQLFWKGGLGLTLYLDSGWMGGWMGGWVGVEGEDNDLSLLPQDLFEKDLGQLSLESVM